MRRQEGPLKSRVRWFRPSAAASLLAIAFLFLIANHSAYGGFFDGDDLDNISWSRLLSARQFGVGFVNPFPNTTGSFRAIGQVMYMALGRTAGLSFTPYVAWIHTVHILTVLTLFLLLQSLGCALPGALAGTLFFALNPAVLDIYWKPMYVYDLTSAFFTVLVLLSWRYDRWIIALLCFWLAIKAKESAAMLALVLVAYECAMGRLRWKRLAPFLAIALVLVLTAISMNKSQPPDYRFHFKLSALLTTGSFYASHLFQIPLAGLAVLLVPLLVRDRRTWFGFATFVILLSTMLFLPSRMFGAYLYPPLIGLSVVAATVLSRPSLIALFFALWLPWTAFVLNREQKELVAAQRENGIYAQSLIEHVRRHGPSPAYICDGIPSAMHPWGVTGLIRMIAPASSVRLIEDPESDGLHDATLLRWDAASQILHIAPLSSL